MKTLVGTPDPEEPKWQGPAWSVGVSTSAAWNASPTVSALVTTTGSVVYTTSNSSSPSTGTYSLRLGPR